MKTLGRPWCRLLRQRQTQQVRRCGCGADNKFFIILFAFRDHGTLGWIGRSMLSSLSTRLAAPTVSSVFTFPDRGNICSDRELRVNTPRQRARTTVFRQPTSKVLTGRNCTRRASLDGLSRGSPPKLFLPVCSCKCLNLQRVLNEGLSKLSSRVVFLAVRWPAGGWGLARLLPIQFLS